MSQYKSLWLILGSFVVTFINIFVFLTMSDYVSDYPTTQNYFMYYLTLALIIVSLPLSYMGYRNLSQLPTFAKIASHIIFWLHVILIGVFLGTLWQALF